MCFFRVHDSSLYRFDDTVQSNCICKLLLLYCSSVSERFFASSVLLFKYIVCRTLENDETAMVTFCALPKFLLESAKLFCKLLYFIEMVIIESLETFFALY